MKKASSAKERSGNSLQTTILREKIRLNKRFPADNVEVLMDPLKTEVLRTLSDSRLQAAPPLDISLRIGSSMQQIVKIMDDLQTHGFVTKTESGQLYALTSKGQQFARELRI